LQALAALLDWIGLFAVFFYGQSDARPVSILMIRGLTPRFVSLYELQNLLLFDFFPLRRHLSFITGGNAHESTPLARTPVFRNLSFVRHVWVCGGQHACANFELLGFCFSYF
jgi:hypothetical protein